MDDFEETYGLSTSDLIPIAAKLFTQGLMGVQTPRQFLDETLYKYSAEQLAPYYNISADVLEKFINYSVPCMEEKIAENINKTDMWTPIWTDW